MKGRTLEFSKINSKESTESTEIENNNILAIGGFETAISCVRNQHSAFSARKARVTKSTHKLTLIHVSVIYQIP